jgi:hypothetical protein
MKGTSLVIPAIFAGIIIAALVVAVNVPYLKTGQIEKDIEVRAQIHTMGNALDAAKLYMDTALAYSTYQACYDNLRSGGLEKASKSYQGYPLWDSMPAGKEAFDQALQKSILSNLELYRKSSYRFMSDYYVNMPAYEVTVLTEQPGKTTVGAWNGSNFYIQKTQESGEIIRLEKYGFLQGEYSIDCYGIYAKGTEVYGNARTAVSDIISQAGLPAKANDMDEIKSKIAETEDKIKAALYSLSATGSDYDVGVDVLSAKINYITLGVDLSGTSLSYTYEIYVKFEVTNIKDGQEFPVYDGSNVVMSPMTLVFVGKFGGS